MTDPSSYTEEEGQIHFFFRAQPGVKEVDTDADVAEFYAILSPIPNAKHRLLVTAKKRLPHTREPGHAGGQERTLGLVARVGDSLDSVKAALDQDTAVGTPVLPAGSGMYSIIGTGLPEAFLIYELLDPAQPGQVQQVLDINKTASFKMLVKNPFATASKSIGPHDPPAWSQDPDKLKIFAEDMRWAPLHDASMLDYERTELQMFPVKRKIEGGLKAGVIDHLNALAASEKIATPVPPGEEHKEPEEQPVTRGFGLTRWIRAM